MVDWFHHFFKCIYGGGGLPRNLYLYVKKMNMYNKVRGVLYLLDGIDLADVKGEYTNIKFENKGR